MCLPLCVCVCHCGLGSPALAVAGVMAARSSVKPLTSMPYNKLITQTFIAVRCVGVLSDQTKLGFLDSVPYFRNSYCKHTPYQTTQHANSYWNAHTKIGVVISQFVDLLSDQSGQFPVQWLILSSNYPFYITKSWIVCSASLNRHLNPSVITVLLLNRKIWLKWSIFHLFFTIVCYICCIQNLDRRLRLK